MDFATLFCREVFRLATSTRATLWKQLASNLVLDASQISKYWLHLALSARYCRFSHPPSADWPHLLPRHDTPGPDHIVRVPRKQRLPIRAPRQTHTLGLPALLTHGRILGLQLVDLALLLQVEDDDGARRGGAEPVSVGGEDEGVDLVAGGQGVEVLGFVEVPEHGRAVLAAGRAEGAVGRNGHGVDVARVADVIGLDAAGAEFPNLVCVSTMSVKTCKKLGHLQLKTFIS